MANENKERIAPAEDFWEGSSANVAVDAIAAAVAEGASQGDLGENSKEEVSEKSTESQETSKEKTEETAKEEKFKFKSHEEAERMYRERQSAADKLAAELERVKSTVADQEKLQASVDKLYKTLGKVEDPELKAAVEEVQTIVNTAMPKTDPYVNELQSRLDRLEARLVAQDAASALETQYPFASEVKSVAADLLAQHAEGTISTDKLVAELSRIGYDAGLKQGRVSAVAAERTGSESSGQPGAVSSDSKKTPSDVEILTRAIVEAAKTKRSYV